MGPDYDNDYAKVEQLLFDELPASQFEEMEHNLETGKWSMVGYAGRVWGIGDGYWDTYEVDLNAGTVRENV